MIDFTGGQPAAAELAQLGAGQMLVMRDGTTQQGRFVNMIGGDTLLWDNAAGAASADSRFATSAAST